MERGIDIAICISTRNRPESFFRSYEFWVKFLPSRSQIFVVDDASKPEYTNADYRFKKRAGIPKVKNKCLELAMKSGAKHIFLVDDDTFPIVDGWEKPYINSGINHLSYSFDKYNPGTGERKPPKIVDDKYKLFEYPNGCLLYFTRECIEKAGGFDERFGMGCYEHTDLTRRIFKMGLTPYNNMDVVGSEKLFHAMDEHEEVERTFDKKERDQLLKDGRGLFRAKEHSIKRIKFM